MLRRHVRFPLLAGLCSVGLLSACGGGGSGLPPAYIDGYWTLHYELYNDPCRVVTASRTQSERVYIEQTDSRVTLHYLDYATPTQAKGDISARTLRSSYTRNSYREELSAYIALDGHINSGRSVEYDSVYWPHGCSVTWTVRFVPAPY